MGFSSTILENLLKQGCLFVNNFSSQRGLANYSNAVKFEETPSHRLMPSVGMASRLRWTPQSSSQAEPWLAPFRKELYNG